MCPFVDGRSVPRTHTEVSLSTGLLGCASSSLNRPQSCSPVSRHGLLPLSECEGVVPSLSLPPPLSSILLSTHMALTLLLSMPL